MPKFTDLGHRPHAVHTGESPRTTISHGPWELDVELLTWGPKDFGGPMVRMLHANWGEEPMRGDTSVVLDPMEEKTLGLCFEGRTLQQVLEGITFWFKIDGISRACTHQIVRTRQAGFMQHGGRDNDWRHRGWTMPETIRRVCNWTWKGSQPEDNPDVAAGLRCVAEGREQPLINLIEEFGYGPAHVAARNMNDPLTQLVVDYLHQGKQLYAALVDAGVPWQDARRVLPMGTQTYIFAQYNYLSLKGFLANRLEPIMDWEINCVAQLMERELWRKCPKVMVTHLGSHSDAAQRDQFSGLTSWPPSGKWPVDEADTAVHRTHEAVQNPFWVLTDKALHGGPIDWIATNGEWPNSPEK